MTDFKIGDRVRAKHDHTFGGSVKSIIPCAVPPLVFVERGRHVHSLPASWLEPVPAPLNPLVPWDVLREVFDLAVEQYRPGERNIGFINSELRARGYGPAEETR